jgi:hypothetical protein
MPKADSQFRSGQSGNPGGRPKGERSVREIAQQHTAAAMETLVTVMQTGKNSERVQAATALLDRGWGKPTQSVEMSGDRTTLVDLLVSLNKSHPVDDAATGSPAITDATDAGDSDTDPFSVPDRHH